ncbi:MAG: Fe-S cluster assembly protein SufD, partial [Polaromonas sp.]
MTTDARAHYLADFSRVAGTLPGKDLPWLNRIRSMALEAFAQNGFPTRHDEEWKYTSVAAFERHAFRALPDISHQADEAVAMLDRFALDKCTGHLLTFHNGRYAPALSSPGRLPAGATLGNLAATLNTAPDALA